MPPEGYNTDKEYERQYREYQKESIDEWLNDLRKQYPINQQKEERVIEDINFEVVESKLM